MPTFVSFPHVITRRERHARPDASFLGKPYDPFFVGQDPNRPDFRLPELSLPASLPPDRLDDRRGLLKLIDRQGELLETSATARGIDAFYDRALTMLASPRVKEAFDLSREDPKLRDAYGRTTYGQSCLLARRLVEAGVRFVTVYFSQSIGGTGSGGWDTHGDNFNQLKNRLLPSTDQTVPTLIDDLDARGLLDETLVVWMGEFGRTPKVINTNSSAPTAATTGRSATPPSSPAAASAAAPSTAPATASAPTRPPTPSAPTTSPPPCSGPWASTPPPRSSTPWAAPCPSPTGGRSRGSSRSPAALHPWRHASEDRWARGRPKWGKSASARAFPAGGTSHPP